MRICWLVMVAACGFAPGRSPGDNNGDGGGDDGPIQHDGPLTTADGGTVFTDAPIPTDLIAWYQMETLVSDVVVDSTGNGHTGGCTSCPTVVAGQIGNGFPFAG